VQNKLAKIAVIMGLGFVLTACSGVGSPDEFSVLKNPPLVVPPDYHLRPPGDDSDVRGAFTPQEIAKRALFGENGA
tara:strand:- start:685 stop:912 length:228 start_codon:yes stop_codon:yes gene_type:complete